MLYPDPSDTMHVGTISGHVLPANPLVLPVSPPGVTGIFPAQVVAVDNATGAVAAAVMAGWSCSDPGPAQFDGSFSIERLAVGTSQNYQIYAEPLDGPVTLGNVIYNLTSLCRNSAKRSRLAGAICVHGAGIRRAFFRAGPPRTIVFG